MEIESTDHIHSYYLKIEEYILKIFDHFMYTEAEKMHQI